jgi:prepilin-type N-terminal cleavage/methylation domain-containing protein
MIRAMRKNKGTGCVLSEMPGFLSENSGKKLYPVKAKPFGAGFTLIEVMIASVLVALAGLVAYHSYNQGILVWKKGQENSNQDKAVMVMERISRDLKNTFSFAPVDFSGEDAKISFPALIFKYDWTQPDESGEPELVSATAESSVPLPLITKLTYEYDQNKGELARIEEAYAYPNLEELKVASDGTRKEFNRVIMDNIDVMKFSYAITKTPELSFSANAINSGLPYAVKIELKLKSMKAPLTRTVFIPINKFSGNEAK